MKTAEEIRYPGIGLLIALGGSLILWYLIFWVGYFVLGVLQ